MYIVNIYDYNQPWCGITVNFQSQTEVLDFISLLHLSQNSDFCVDIRYERSEQNK